MYAILSYYAQADRRLHFGLGSLREIERITVAWPGRSGFREEFAPQGVDRFVTLVQGEGRRLD